MDEGLRLTFAGVIGYGAADAEEAAHFFEHTLGLKLSDEDGALRFYALADGLAVAVDVSGALAGERPYPIFTADDLTAAAEHFLQRGCHVRELPWAEGAGFLARSSEGHTVCVVGESALDED
jgi:catechol 2,3-dioxygenase-like lactoylglutathione lyase family enzyme